MLSSLVARVKQDNTLAFEIRDLHVSLYYRGGKLAEIKESAKGGYQVKMHAGYFSEESRPPIEFPFMIQGPDDVAQLIRALPHLKEAIDLFDKKDMSEREFQQLILRENNYSRISNDTDYILCDMEYTHSKHTNLQLDLVAAKWLSTSLAHQTVENLKLAIIEVKYGEGALTGSASIQKHVHDLHQLAGHLDSLKEEMTAVMRQKAELGLIKKGKLAEEKYYQKIGFSSDSITKPEWILILANHKSASSVLMRELKILQQAVREHGDFPFDMRVATSSFMGYGLYDDSIYPLDAFINRIETQKLTK